MAWAKNQKGIRAEQAQQKLSQLAKLLATIIDDKRITPPWLRETVQEYLDSIQQFVTLEANYADIQAA